MLIIKINLMKELTTRLANNMPKQYISYYQLLINNHFFMKSVFRKQILIITIKAGNNHVSQLY